MRTTRHIRPAAAAAPAARGFGAERVMAWLVLLTIALSVMGAVAGHAEAEGKAKAGVRRAASQLERKDVRIPMVKVGQVRIA